MLAVFLPEPTSNFNISIVMFLQLAIILATCRVVGWLAKKLLDQPQVVGEMIAGVVLGPSLLGLVVPEFHASVFPKPNLTVIYCLAQIGLVLYMFTVGLEFDVGLIRRRVRSALSVSLAGIIVPFGLGCGLAAWLLHDHDLFSENVELGEAMLFMGAAMSITAFPMLARIIYERGLSGTSLGTLALAAGSSDDAAAWCILAIVLASFKGDPAIAALAIGGGVGYALLMILGARPLLARLEKIAAREASLSSTMLVFVLCVLMLAAYLTDAIGIYAVFGAFILGIAMPRGVLNTRLQQSIGPLTTGLLLPMFFVSSGLNTKLGLVDTPHLWLVALLVLLAACVGKGVACFTAAKLSGEPTRDALAVGALMNARGLMELIILNIGYEAGLITQRLFSIMVIMAIVTTLMATPLFNLIYGRRGRGPAPAPEAPA